MQTCPFALGLRDLCDEFLKEVHLRRSDPITEPNQCLKQEGFQIRDLFLLLDTRVAKFDTHHIGRVGVVESAQEHALHPRRHRHPHGICPGFNACVVARGETDLPLPLCLGHTYTDSPAGRRVKRRCYQRQVL